MAFSIRFNEEKNQLLKVTRKICFDDVISAIKKGELLADIDHPGGKHQNQRLYVIAIDDYIYAVPYVKNVIKKEIFLKTIYPSRVLMKKYKKGIQNEKNK